MVLLDVMLGDENGLEICKRLRHEQDVPIIMVSALSADHQRMEGYAVGADDYIAKPFRRSRLWDPDQHQDRHEVSSWMKIILDQTMGSPKDANEMEKLDSGLEEDDRRTMC